MSGISQADYRKDWITKVIRSLLEEHGGLGNGNIEIMMGSIMEECLLDMKQIGMIEEELPHFYNLVNDPKKSVITFLPPEEYL